ncbi:vacuolar protein sorting-associated protein-like protein 74 [Aureobasidium pullulans]|uniref:Vacuolar protein sorting-associated protein-like protein 74 n=1 Tax=Aureobasidium pullulans TaxID=5580 RepID=A0A4S9SG15_AURPU|nr:vacuolar protein sorting-associated protein-like protein 74 [Aureobasidium pullulans]THW49090.1 vacuolar protein sorting-associated protein-like protein 74 [Aureobasidium pullulans]THW65758.1 vacuolar protein sorting-associated protein-like protein 74 [Aureobasidium pullulans]THW79762.1 vacuolar protein sorting-associated protein-like protein 74 [Aureobasidium pullulans]THW89607.1 vacuolar protein sorting-associated protein-like protein 74 [Aureobasidium pullulans]
MASSSGLTRRRGGAGGAGGLESEDGSRVSSPAPTNKRNEENRGLETSYESGENGHKIAFDPRDISESAERNKQPKLTLMEEILLMGLKDKQIGYQLKQVRERLAKGLVDKGILRTEKRNFLLFDMATHPVADGGAKDEIRRRVRNVLTNRTVVLPPTQYLPEEMEFRYLRTIAMVCGAYAANVLENALTTLGHEARERAFAQVDELLAEYSQYPFARRTGGPGSIGANLGQVIMDEVNTAKDKELQLEVVAACLSVFTRLDSLL